MDSTAEHYLNLSLRKLEKALEEVVKTRGYTAETASLKMLQELVKEQLPNESASYTTRQTR